MPITPAENVINFARGTLNTAATALLKKPSKTPSKSDIYASLMLEHKLGYPLYAPEPDQNHPMDYRKTGVRIGDVGLITADGSFDFLFNVCSGNQDVNPSKLPDNFQVIDDLELSKSRVFQSNTCLFGGIVRQTDHRYASSSPPAAVLELPLGAILYQARTEAAFQTLASDHAENWYTYARFKRERTPQNGSLYLVTGCIKCHAWGIAVFGDKRVAADESAGFAFDDRSRRGHWTAPGSILTNCGPCEDVVADEPNQCVFLRGYTITLEDKVWSKLGNHGSSYWPWNWGRLVR